MKNKTKVLTCCRGGQVRSVALKYLLSYWSESPCDVLACGVESNTEETRKMLYEWADYIVVMTPDFAQWVPKEFHEKNGKRKLFCYDVGEDRFMNPFHPELQAMLKQMILNHGLFKTGQKEKEYPKK